MATIRKLRGRWQAQVRRRGMKPRCKSFDTKLEAEKWARDLETQVDRFGAAPDTKILESTTLGQLLERYQRDVSPLKRGAVQEIQRIDVLRRHELAYRTLIGLSQQDIASFRDGRLQSVAPSTTVRELAILSHVLEVAIRDWGLPLAKNVVKLVRRPVIRNERSRRLTGDEEQRLLDGCNGGKIPYFRTLIILAIETGMRRGELLGLQWADVSHNRRVISLSMTKNGASREVPLSQRAFDTLMDWRSRAEIDQATVFPMSPGALEQIWRRLLSRSGVTALRFHDLRHEGVSRLFERGLNVIEVSSISGHREVRMLKRYTHLSADDLVTRLDASQPSVTHTHA
jgi:integrase